MTQEKQYDNRHDRTRAYSHRDSSQNDRFTKNETAYNRPSRDRAYHKHDKSEINGFKDLDTSFKGNSKRGKGSFNRDGFNNGREESYDNRASDRLQTSKWNDRKPIMARKPNYKNEKLTGI